MESHKRWCGELAFVYAVQEYLLFVHLFCCDHGDDGQYELMCYQQGTTKLLFVCLVLLCSCPAVLMKTAQLHICAVCHIICFTAAVYWSLHMTLLEFLAHDLRVTGASHSGDAAAGG